MSAYIIALLTFTDLLAYREYQAAFAEVFARFDAQLLVADEAPVLLEGGYSPEKIVVIEFPSHDEALRFVNDADYQRISKDREKGAVTLSVLASGIAAHRVVA